ncbi:hypothetical protein V866_004080 [Kwoniella sp. B9012]
MSSPFRMTPLRNRSQTQSHIPYKPLSRFEPSTDLSIGWRGGEIQPKWFLLVEYGKDFLMEGRDRAEYDEDEEGGSLLVILQPTVHQQLIHLISQLQLPSPLGLSLHLTVPGSKHRPRLTDVIWPTFFSSYLLPSHSHHVEAVGNLPIVGTVSLRVDKRAARWYEVWKKDPQDGMIGKWSIMRGVIQVSSPIHHMTCRLTQSIYLSTKIILPSPMQKKKGSQRLTELNKHLTPPITSTSPLRRNLRPSLFHPYPPSPTPILPDSTPEISSRSSTPLSLHSIPYSPVHSLPDPEALATQPFLKELYQPVSITQRARSDSDLAKRRGKEGLTIDTKKEIRPPWADLGSAMWSVGTSWGPPTTPEGWDLSPSHQQRQRLQAQVEIEEKAVSDLPAKIDFTASPRTAPPIPDDASEPHDTAPRGSQNDHGTWTFLPKSPVTPTPWKFGWPFHEVVALPSNNSIQIHNPPSGSPVFPAKAQLNEDQDVNMISNEVVLSRGTDFQQEMEFFESQSQVIHDQLEHLQVSPLPMNPSSLHTPAFELDSPFEIETEEGIEFEETYPAPSTESVETPIEEITLSISSPDSNSALSEEFFAPLERCPRPSDQVYSQADTSYLRPCSGRQMVDPISPFDLDIPVSPFDEDDNEEGVDFSMSNLRRPSVLGFAGTQLDVIEEMSNWDISSPASLKVDSPRYFEEVTKDHSGIISVLKDPPTDIHVENGKSDDIGRERCPDVPLESEETPIDNERTSQVIPRLPTPHTRLSEHLSEDGHRPRSPAGGSYDETRDLTSSPVPFQDCMEQDIPSPTSLTTDHLLQYPYKAQHPVDEDENSRSRSSFMGNIKPLFRSKSQKDRFRSRSSSVGERAPSFISYHDQTNQSAISLASTNTTTAGKEPKRPLKRLSQRLSGFGSCPEGGGRKISPLGVAVPDQEGNMMISKLYDKTGVECHCQYPNLVIYPTPRQRQRPIPTAVSIPIYQHTYPDMVIYKPTTQKCVKQGSISDRSMDHGLSRIPISLVGYLYPDMVLYPSPTLPSATVQSFSLESSQGLTVESITLTRYDYPNIVVYPPCALTSHEVLPTPLEESRKSSDEPVTLIRYSYPNIVLYPPSRKIQTIPLKVPPHGLAVEPTTLIRYRYPNIVVYPPSRKIQSIPLEVSQALTVGPVTIARYLYPNIVIYPSIPSNNLACSSITPIQVVKPIPILLCQTTYPGMKVYPTVLSIQLVQYNYPSIVIYPCRNKGITKIKTELLSETRYQATRYPSESIDPKELLLGARRRYSILKASLDSDRSPTGQRTSTIKKYTHQRGSSSISSISSSSIVTPVSELPPFSLDDLNIHASRKISPIATPFTMESSSKATVPDYFPVIESSASHQSEEGVTKPIAQNTNNHVESDAEKKKRSSTFISERMKAFSSPQAANQAPFSPPSGNRRSRSTTYDDFDQGPREDSPFSPGLGKELEGGKKVGRLSRDLMKKWI